MTVATPTIRLAIDSGDETDLITNDYRLTISGAASGVTRTYTDQSGTWPDYSGPEGEGLYTVMVTDTLGSSSASASITFTLDTIDPSTPEVSLENDTGDSNADGLTRYAYLTENAPDAGATRSYSLNGSATDSYVMPSADGSYVLVVTDTDVAGNAVSTTLEFTLDTTLATPTAVLALGGGDIGSQITNSAVIVFSEYAAGVSRSYTVNDGEASADFVAPTAEGTYKVYVLDTDAAGNTASATLIFALDTTLSVPTAALAQDSGDNKADAVTNSAELSLSAPDADATRTFYLDGVASATYVAPVEDGSHTVLVTDTDVAGNTAGVSLTFTLDSTLTTPTIAFGAGSDSGTSATDHVSNSAALIFNDVDADATRTYTLSKGLDLVSVGVQYVAPVADGSYTLVVQDTDTAGNTKLAQLNFTLDTTAPTPPKVQLYDDSGIRGDGLSNSAALTFSTKDADASRTYTLSLNGAAIFQGAQYSVPTVDGDYVLVVQDTDTSGNTSSAEIDFTLDTTLIQPTLSMVEDSGVAGDFISQTATLIFSEAAQGVSRSYSVNGVSVGASYSTPTANGTYAVVVTDTDTAGNVKTASLSFQLDNSIKSPTVALANGYTGGGTTDSAAMVFNTKDADATRIYTITVGSTSTDYTEYVAPVYNGDYEVKVTDTDVAGNTASASVYFALYSVLAIPTVELTINSGDTSDAISNSAALTFSTAAPDVTRTFSLNGAAASNTYSAPRADGTYTVVVTDTDLAHATETATFRFTLDTTLDLPTVSLLTDSGNTHDGLTNVADLVLSTAASDVTRTYAVNGVAVADLGLTADGTYALVVKDTDQAGNEKSASLSFTLDTTLTTPTLALLHGSTQGTAHSAAMTFNAPDGDATRIYTVTSNGISVADSKYVAPTTNGTYQVLVTDTDTAGNSASANLNFTLEIIGKTVDFQAYHWKSHVLLGDVVVSDGSQTDTTENGLGQFTAVTESSLLVTADRAIPALEADITSAAVNLQDAIAILKMVVGLDVNGSGKALSPYQALAADFNGDGMVSLTDAIGVLKHVVGLSQTSAPHWAFANEADLTVPAKANTAPGFAPAISSDLGDAVNVHIGLVGYLVGDVDGSYAGASNASNLLTSDPTYFSDLVTGTSGLSLSQFGVYPTTGV